MVLAFICCLLMFRPPLGYLGDGSLNVAAPSGCTHGYAVGWGQWLMVSGVVLMWCVGSDGGGGLHAPLQDGDLCCRSREEERQKCNGHARDIHRLSHWDSVSIAVPIVNHLNGTTYVFLLKNNLTVFGFWFTFPGPWMQLLKVVTQPLTLCGGDTVNLNCCGTT